MTAEFPGMIGFRCDGQGVEPSTTCAHYFDSRFFRMQDASKSLQAAGWKAVRKDDQWKHYCGRCAVNLEKADASQA